MEYRLDDHLRRLDKQAIEDGQQQQMAYCHVHGGYVPVIAMPPLPDMACAWCENDLRDVDEFTDYCRKHQEQVRKRKLAQLTLEDARGG